MKLKLNIKTEVKIIVAIAGLSFLIAFSERKQSGVVCKNLIVEMENTHENHFLDEADVLKMVESSGETIIGKSTSDINLRALETKLENNKHILNAEIFGDIKGNVTINVKLRRPVARLVRENGPDAYVAEDGKIMSTSEKYSARILIISGAPVSGWIESGDLYTSESGTQLMELIEFVNDDSFWKAQVAQVDISERGKATIYPQVTGQVVQFGKLDDLEIKFRKLMIFYKEILPQRGWTKYDRVNVEYEGQVIAE